MPQINHSDTIAITSDSDVADRAMLDTDDLVDMTYSVILDGTEYRSASPMRIVQRSIDNVLRLYDERSEWVATLAYGSRVPDAAAIRSKIAEYSAHEGVLVEHIDGREMRRTAYHI